MTYTFWRNLWILDSLLNPNPKSSIHQTHLKTQNQKSRILRLGLSSNIKVLDLVRTVISRYLKQNKNTKSNKTQLNPEVINFKLYLSTDASNNRRRDKTTNKFRSWYHKSSWAWNLKEAVILVNNLRKMQVFNALKVIVWIVKLGSWSISNLKTQKRIRAEVII